MTNDVPPTPGQENRNLQISAKDLSVKLMGAGVKGKNVVLTKGKYSETVFVHLNKRDPHHSGKTKLVNLFNDALSQADKLNLPYRGFTTALRDLVEGRGFVDGLIGQFIMAYGRFEGMSGTRGSGTCQAMRRLASKNDFLISFAKDGREIQEPAPYVVRNWLAHMGSDRNNYDINDLTKAYDLLVKWMGVEPSS